nr:DNA-directed RNA polymerase II subunit RPB1-like [Bactrocera oleae]
MATMRIEIFQVLGIEKDAVEKDASALLKFYGLYVNYVIVLRPCVRYLQIEMESS